MAGEKPSVSRLSALLFPITGTDFPGLKGKACRLELLRQHTVDNGVDDSPVAEVCLAQDALAAQAAFGHHPPGAGVFRVVPGLDPVCPDFLEQIGKNSGKSLAGNAPVPPSAADAITNLKQIQRFPDAYYGNGADGFVPFLFQYDGPLIKVRAPVAVDPILQDRFGDRLAFVSGPGEEFRDLFIAGPILKGRRGVLLDEAPQQKPGRFYGKKQKCPEILGFLAQMQV